MGWLDPLGGTDQDAAGIGAEHDVVLGRGFDLGQVAGAELHAGAFGGAVEQPGCADAALGQGLFVDGEQARVQPCGEFGALAADDGGFRGDLGQLLVQFGADAAKGALDVVNDLLLGGLARPAASPAVPGPPARRPRGPSGAC